MKRNAGAWCVVVAIAGGVGIGGLAGCNTVERTITGKPRIERPVEVVYKFENVRRTPSINEWDSIRRILYLHARGSVDITDTNTRRYDQTDLRDYVARFTIPDASHITKINEEVDALAGEKVAGQRLRFAMTKAEITFAGDNLAASHDVILRGVTLPAATVKLYPRSGLVEAPTDQYGAWAKRVPVGSGEDHVFGYAEGRAVTAGSPATRRYFRINVFTMTQDTITEAQFNARSK